MIYVGLNKETSEFVISTNMRRLSEFSGLPYHRLYRALGNGSGIAEMENYLFLKSEPEKGRQKISERARKALVEKQKEDDDVVDARIDYINSVTGHGEENENKLSSDKLKNSIDGFDDYFKEIK